MQKGIAMNYRTTLASLAVIATLAAMPALAADEQHDPHHPRGTPAAAAAPPAGMQGGMMGGSDSGMPMMGMMRMMMGGDGMAGMQMMAQHVEGRIAFLKTELKITDPQLPLWNAFAQAMRDNATTMQGAMIGMGQGSALPDKLAGREKMLTSRLEVVRKLKAAADPLYATLSADQKKTADEVMVGPMGMIM
jgi:hypothetical protein